MLNVIALLGENKMISILVVTVLAMPTVIVLGICFNDSINAICGR